MGAPTSFTFPLWGIFPGHDFGCFLWTQQRPSAYCYPVWLPAGNHLYTSHIHCHSYVLHETHLYAIILTSREIYPPRNALFTFVHQSLLALALRALGYYDSTLWTILCPDWPRQRGWDSRQAQKHIPTVVFLASTNSKLTVPVSYFWWSVRYLGCRQSLRQHTVRIIISDLLKCSLKLCVCVLLNVFNYF